MRLLHVLLALAAVAAAAGLTLGCSSAAATQEAFASIDAVAARIGVDRLGSIASDRRAGSAENLGEKATRRVAVVAAGTTTQVADGARAAIRAAELQPTGADAWAADQDGRRITVLLAPLTPGTTPPGTTAPIPAGSAGVYLTLGLSS